MRTTDSRAVLYGRITVMLCIIGREERGEKEKQISAAFDDIDS